MASFGNKETPRKLKCTKKKPVNLSPAIFSAKKGFWLKLWRDEMWQVNRRTNWKLVGGRISFCCGKFLEWLLLFREKCERAAWESNNAIFYLGEQIFTAIWELPTLICKRSGCDILNLFYSLFLSDPGNPGVRSNCLNVCRSVYMSVMMLRL